MRIRYVFIPVLAALFLAACGDEQTAEAPNEYDVGPTEEAAPAEEPVVEEEVGEPLVITVPSAEQVQENVTQTAEEVVEQVTQQAEQVAEQAADVVDSVRDAAAEQLNAITNSQPAADAVETAEDVVQGVATAITDQLNALVPDQPAEEIAATADWQSTFSNEVPFYNLSEEPVMAYDAPEGSTVVATIEPGGGGYIETCNATLDWCALSLGDGSTVWVNMAPFGGVAN